MAPARGPGVAGCYRTRKEIAAVGLVSFLVKVEAKQGKASQGQKAKDTIEMKFFAGQRPATSAAGPVGRLKVRAHHHGAIVLCSVS